MKKSINLKINDEISSKEIRIVNIGEEYSSKVISLAEGIRLADEQETDLIEISSNGNTSICKLMDLDKYLYQEKKKQKALSQNKSDQKEIKLSVDIADNDFNIKVNHAKKFLEKGDRVKVSLMLKGRRSSSQIIKDQAKILILRFVDDLSDVGKAKELPEWQGNRIFIQINPK